MLATIVVFLVIRKYIVNTHFEALYTLEINTNDRYTVAPSFEKRETTGVMR